MKILKRIFKWLFNKKKPQEKGVDSLKRAIENVTGIEFKDIAGPMRFEEVVEARILFAFLAAKHFNINKKEIASIINKSKTTIYNYITEGNIRKDYDSFQNKLKAIKSELK